MELLEVDIYVFICILYVLNPIDYHDYLPTVTEKSKRKFRVACKFFFVDGACVLYNSKNYLSNFIT